MADSFLAQKLAHFTDREHPEPCCHRPFTLQLDDQPWSVACAAAWLFAVRGTSSYEAGEPSELILRMLRTAPVGAEEVETRRLQKWAGGPYKEAEGQIAAGLLLGRPIDRRKLAALLAPVPFPKLVVWDVSAVVGVTSLAFESKGKWRGVLAGTHGEPSHETPVYALYQQPGLDILEEMAD